MNQTSPTLSHTSPSASTNSTPSHSSLAAGCSVLAIAAIAGLALPASQARADLDFSISLNFGWCDPDPCDRYISRWDDCDDDYRYEYRRPHSWNSGWYRYAPCPPVWYSQPYCPPAYSYARPVVVYSYSSYSSGYYSSYSYSSPSYHPSFGFYRPYPYSGWNSGLSVSFNFFDDDCDDWWRSNRSYRRGYRHGYRDGYRDGRDDNAFAPRPIAINQPQPINIINNNNINIVGPASALAGGGVATLPSTSFSNGPVQTQPFTGVRGHEGPGSPFGGNDQLASVSGISRSKPLPNQPAVLRDVAGPSKPSTIAEQGNSQASRAGVIKPIRFDRSDRSQSAGELGKPVVIQPVESKPIARTMPGAGSGIGSNLANGSNKPQRLGSDGSKPQTQFKPVTTQPVEIKPQPEFRPQADFADQRVRTPRDFGQPEIQKPAPIAAVKPSAEPSRVPGSIKPTRQARPEIVPQARGRDIAAPQLVPQAAKPMPIADQPRQSMPAPTAREPSAPSIKPVRQMPRAEPRPAPRAEPRAEPRVGPRAEPRPMPRGESPAPQAKPAARREAPAPRPSPSTGPSKPMRKEREKN